MHRNCRMPFCPRVCAEIDHLMLGSFQVPPCHTAQLHSLGRHYLNNTSFYRGSTFVFISLATPSQSNMLSNARSFRISDSSIIQVNGNYHTQNSDSSRRASKVRHEEGILLISVF